MKKTSFIIILLIIFFAACKRNTNNSSTVKIDSIDSISKKVKDRNLQVENVTTINKDSIPNDSSNLEISNKINRCPIFTEYKIPSPGDFKYAVAITKPNFDILFPISKRTQLTNTIQKSLALGIISADLFYSAIYGNANYTTKYLNTALKLSDDLGTSNVFTQENLETIRQFENKDTIKKIIFLTLETICSQLNDSKTYNQLPFFIYGGWLESIYLLTNTLNSNQDAPKKLFKELAKQKEIIQNLIDYYNKTLLDVNDYETNLNIQNIIGELGTLDSIFGTSQRNENYIMNKEQMQDLIKTIKDVRSSIFVHTEKKIEQQQQQYQKTIEK